MYFFFLCIQGTTSDTGNQSDNAEEHQRYSTTLHKMKKGNLKCEGSIRGSRRVSFDPLALLLDAALEGELELVKKTANEVRIIYIYIFVWNVLD